MPIFEYQCDVYKFKTEVLILSVSTTIREVVDCANCKGFAKRIPSMFNNAFSAPPTLIFRNPRTGEVKLLTREKDKYSPPRGFVVEEVKGSIERSRLEREMAQKQHAENEIVTETHRQIKSESTKSRHDEINANMSKFDKDTQSLLKTAMKRNKKKELPAKKTEFKFDVNHLNKSNMEQG